MRRTLLLAAAGLAIFVVAVAGMVLLMPRPMQPSDYLVSGTVATLVAILVMFLAVASTGEKTKDIFFKRRPKR